MAYHAAPSLAHLPPFLDACCVKCGGRQVSVTYKPSQHISVPERLVLTCSCGYAWDRPCLDAKKDKE